MRYLSDARLRELEQEDPEAAALYGMLMYEDEDEGMPKPRDEGTGYRPERNTDMTHERHVTPEAFQALVECSVNGLTHVTYVLAKAASKFGAVTSEFHKNFEELAEKTKTLHELGWLEDTNHDA